MKFQIICVFLLFSLVNTFSPFPNNETISRAIHRLNEEQCSKTKACPVKACCSKWGNCGFGPDFCSNGCLRDCDAKPECGKYSDTKECPLVSQFLKALTAALKITLTNYNNQNCRKCAAVNTDSAALQQTFAEKDARTIVAMLQFLEEDQPEHTALDTTQAGHLPANAALFPLTILTPETIHT